MLPDFISFRGGTFLLSDELRGELDGSILAEPVSMTAADTEPAARRAGTHKEDRLLSSPPPNLPRQNFPKANTCAASGPAAGRVWSWCP